MKCAFIAAAVSAFAGANALRASNVSGTRFGTRIPEVEVMMRPSNEVVRGIRTDFAKLTEKVLARQQQARDSLVNQKASLEAVLAERMRANRGIYNRTLQFKSGINATLKHMEVLRRDNDAIRNSSNIMRATIKGLQSMVNLASAFLNRTDEDVKGLNASETEALSPTTPEPTLEYYLAEARAELGLRPVSLLQIGETDNRAAREMMPRLSWTVEKVARAQDHGMEMLFESFDKVNQSQTLRTAKLINWSARLANEWGSLNNTQADLWVAKKHLDHTNIELRERLQSIRSFQKNIRKFMDDILVKSAHLSGDVTQ